MQVIEAYAVWLPTSHLDAEIRGLGGVMTHSLAPALACSRESSLDLGYWILEVGSRSTDLTCFANTDSRL
jgi:hypothetical protein